MDTPTFHKDGAIGKQFKADRAIGSIGEKVGGPSASDGANFNPDGKLGAKCMRTWARKNRG